MRHHNVSFWRFYILAVLIGILGVLWMGFALPEGYSPAMFTEVRNSIGLNHFSILVPLAMTATYPLAFFGILFPAAPTLSAIIMSAKTGGKKQVKALFSRLKPWRDGVTRTTAMKVYGSIIFLHIVLFAAVLLKIRVMGTPEELKMVMSNLRFHAPSLMILFFVMDHFLDTGALLEEVGWRGYGLPLLMEKMSSPLAAAVFLGFFWALWHFPREVFGLMAGNSPAALLINQIGFIINSIALTIIIVYFMNLTGGSVLPAIMLHGISNYIAETTVAVPDGPGFDFLGLLKCIIALVLILYAGKQLGYHSK